MPGYGVFPGAKTSAIFIYVLLFAHLRLIHSYIHMNITFAKCTHTRTHINNNSYPSWHTDVYQHMHTIYTHIHIHIHIHTQTGFVACTSHRRFNKMLLFRSYLVGTHILWFEMYPFEWPCRGVETLPGIPTRVRQRYQTRFNIQYARGLWKWSE